MAVHGANVRLGKVWETVDLSQIRDRNTANTECNLQFHPEKRKMKLHHYITYLNLVQPNQTKLGQTKPTLSKPESNQTKLNLTQTYQI